MKISKQIDYENTEIIPIKKDDALLLIKNSTFFYSLGW